MTTPVPNFSIMTTPYGPIHVLAGDQIYSDTDGKAYVLSQIERMCSRCGRPGATRGEPNNYWVHLYECSPKPRKQPKLCLPEWLKVSANPAEWARELCTANADKHLDYGLMHQWFTAAMEAVLDSQAEGVTNPHILAIVRRNAELRKAIDALEEKAKADQARIAELRGWRDHQRDLVAKIEKELADAANLHARDCGLLNNMERTIYQVRSALGVTLEANLVDAIEALKNKQSPDSKELTEDLTRDLNTIRQALVSAGMPEPETGMWGSTVVTLAILNMIQKLVAERDEIQAKSDGYAGHLADRAAERDAREKEFKVLEKKCEEKDRIIEGLRVDVGELRHKLALWNTPGREPERNASPLLDKPPVVNWSALPAWAHWIAMSGSRQWRWFTKQPVMGNEYWHDCDDLGEIVPRLFSPAFTGRWQDSLVCRPQYANPP